MSQPAVLPLAGMPDIWTPIYRAGDAVLRGRKGDLLTFALGASGMVYDRAAFAGTYAAHRTAINQYAEHINLAAVAGQMGVGKSILTPFTVGVLVGAAVAYAAIR